MTELPVWSGTAKRFRRVQYAIPPFVLPWPVRHSTIGAAIGVPVAAFAICKIGFAIVGAHFSFAFALPVVVIAFAVSLVASRERNGRLAIELWRSAIAERLAPPVTSNGPIRARESKTVSR
jgi:hypothetical protein